MRSPGVTAALAEKAAEIARLRVKVHTLPLDELRAEWWGGYDGRTHTIHLAESLGPLQARSTLAHELSHAEHRHQGSSTDENNGQEARHTAAQWLFGPCGPCRSRRRPEHRRGSRNRLRRPPRDIHAFIEARLEAAAQAIMGTLATHAGNLTIPRPSEYRRSRAQGIETLETTP
ncbi:ImmA/IrrE family metallo-endopeptidase [Arthrobacter sp.]|uniref:ImmA/IrrE family metallo-endopeptidase n=1 Tax=Arthrobacter sp. TaxID=1667 RepID=UPI003A8C9854